MSSPRPSNSNENVSNVEDTTMDHVPTRDNDDVPATSDLLSQRNSEEPMAMDVDEPSENLSDSPKDIPAPVKKKREAKKGGVAYERVFGTTSFPISRVQKIIKADKDIPIVAKDATFLISLATEEFIKRICEAGSKAASRDNRSTVQGKDIASAVRRVDEFLFLEDVLPWITTEPKRQSKVNQIMKNSLKATPTMLDQFVEKQPQSIEEDMAGDSSS